MTKLIITALPEERDALLNRLDSYHYKEAGYSSGKLGTLEIIVALTDDMGNIAAANTATKLIERLQPSSVIMMGIAAGVPDKVKLGDVVVANFCHYYELAKIKAGGEEQRRNRQFRTSICLYQSARNFRSKDWHTGIQINLPNQQTSHHPQVHFGPIASGDKVIANADHLATLVKECSELLAVAMEGAGVAWAVEGYKIDFIEIRGISDFADEHKNDDWHEYAANAAATFLIAWLQSEVFPIESARKPIKTPFPPITKLPSEAGGNLQEELTALNQQLADLQAQEAQAAQHNEAAEQRELTRQRLLKQDEIARKQRQVDAEAARQQVYETALVDDRAEQAEMSEQAKARLEARLAELRQLVEQKHQRGGAPQPLQSAIMELQQVDELIKKTEADYAQEQTTQQKKNQKGLQKALAELGEFKPAPRDRFEKAKEYEQRLVREKAEYAAQQEKIHTSWQEAWEKLAQQIKEARIQNLEVLQKQRTALLNQEFDIPPAQLVLQLTDYNADEELMQFEIIAEEIMPGECHRTQGATLSIAPQEAKICWQRWEQDRQLLVPYFLLGLDAEAKPKLIKAGFETAEGQRYCVSAAFQVEPSTKAKEAEEVERQKSEIEEQPKTWFGRLATLWSTASGSNESSQSQVILVEQNETHVHTKTFDFEIVLVNAKGEIIQRESKQAQCEIEDLGNGVTLEMVSIPGGTFTMGSPKTEKEREPWKKGTESPQHSVTVQPFWMGKYPITQRQWQAVMGNNPARFKGDNRPVEKISWHEVVEFCQRLSEKTGKTYRLPSEAEWEYACRAGTTTPFYFGESITTDLVNYNGNHPYASAPKGIRRGETTEVGIFPPNAFGLYDMHGNVWEWCADPWHDNYNGAPTDGSVWQKADSGLFVRRGGSWFYYAWGSRAAYRYWIEPTNRLDILGVRLAWQ